MRTDKDTLHIVYVLIRIIQNCQEAPPYVNKLILVKKNILMKIKQYHNNSTVQRSPPPHQRVRLCMKRAERTTVDPSSKSMVKDLTFPSSPGWSSVTLPNLSHFLLSLSLTTTLSPKLKASLLQRTFLRALFLIYL